MLCYKDQTFCGSDCINDKCWRYLSDADERRGKAMNLPFAMADLSGSCKEYEGGRDETSS